MAAPNSTFNSQSNSLIRPEARRKIFGVDSASALQLVPRPQRPIRIAVIGNHLPRQCGIATFTTDLCDAIVAECEAVQLSVVAVNDGQSSYSYPERVRFEISEGDIASYRAAADFLNGSNVDLVCLQHEYGIFGGKSGSHIMELLKRLKMPVLTTLHTVLREPNLDQRVAMHKIAARSERLIVMSQYSSRVLQEVFRVPAEKINLIPHGIPDLPFERPEAYKELFSCQGKTVLLTFGLLSPNKGFENVIQAMPRILLSHSNAIYMIAGATHPHVRAQEGDRYRLELQALAKKLGVERQVLFVNRFVTHEEMASLVGLADIYITPYCHEAQAVSGTLAYAMGAGKAIISTPYWHAAELLDSGRGVLVPFENSAAIAAATIALLANDEACQAMREQAYLYARPMVWRRVAQSYMAAFLRARAHYMEPVQVRFAVQASVRDSEQRVANA
ncbi:MAG TPA: glycosyltransferase family 4 protein [Acidobacteriaceae bacterium]|nr:glycosyltransferase family 4 protein [Acidobacteriaceae bacterium]